jgi:hypothetical protein
MSPSATTIYFRCNRQNALFTLLPIYLFAYKNDSFLLWSFFPYLTLIKILLNLWNIFKFYKLISQI